MTASLTGRASTERAARYAKQLCSHLGRKLDTTFDEAATVGFIRKGDGVVTLTSTSHSLEIAVTAANQEDMFTLMAITQNHLERFGDKDELSCKWDDATLMEAYEAQRAEMHAKRAAARAARAAEEAAASQPAS